MKRNLAFALVLLIGGFCLQSSQNHAAPAPEKLLRHVVLFKFKAEAKPEQIQEVVTAFGELKQKIDTIHAYEWGTDVSPEGKSKGFTHCFLVTFKDAAGRDAYLPHEAHKAFVKKLLPILDDATVLDYWTN